MICAERALRDVEVADLHREVRELGRDDAVLRVHVERGREVLELAWPVAEDLCDAREPVIERRELARAASLERADRAQEEVLRLVEATAADVRVGEERRAVEIGRTERVRLFERRDRRGDADLLGRDRILRVLEEELTGAHEAFEARGDVSRGVRLFEDELGELLQGTELFVEPREALAERDVVRRGHARALETAARVGEATGLLARLGELQRGRHDAVLVLEPDEATVRRARGVPSLLELVDVRDRAERRLVLAVGLEQLGEDVACVLDVAHLEAHLRDAQAVLAPESRVAATRRLHRQLAEVLGERPAQVERGPSRWPPRSPRAPPRPRRAARGAGATTDRGRCEPGRLDERHRSRRRAPRRLASARRPR